MFNKLYVYDDILGFEKKEIYERIKDVQESRQSAYKILVLGDSITEWGKYVEFFKDLLVKKYNNNVIEVINAGIMGYNTELEYNYLKHRGLNLNPDLVIVQFCINDFMGTPVIIKQKDGSWLALDGDKKLSKWIKPALFAKSKLYEFITLRLLYFSKKRAGYKDNVKEPLCKIKQLLEEKRIPFYLLIFPPLGESHYGKLTYDAIMDIVKELNLSSNTIDLLPYYSRVPLETIKIDLTHPNREGDRIAAAALIEKLSHLLDKQFNLK